MYKRLPCYLCEGRIRRLFLRSALFLVRPGVIHCARITPIAPPPLSLSFSLFFRVFENGTRQRFYTRPFTKDSAAPRAAGEKAPLPLLRAARGTPSDLQNNNASDEDGSRVVFARERRNHRGREKRQVTRRRLPPTLREIGERARLKSNVDVFSLALVEALRFGLVNFINSHSLIRSQERIRIRRATPRRFFLRRGLPSGG